MWQKPVWSPSERSWIIFTRLITASCALIQGSLVHFNSLSAVDSAVDCRHSLWWEGHEYKWKLRKWLHTKKTHYALSWWIIWLSIVTVNDKVSSATMNVAVGQRWWWWVVSSSEGTTKDFHRPSCLAAIFTAPRTHLVSTQAVFQKKDQCMETTAVTLMHHGRVGICQSQHQFNACSRCPCTR